jgi:hypothetical protein
MDADVKIVKHQYANNRIALQLIDEHTGEPQMTATTNLVDHPCPDGYAYIKDFSENEGILAELIRVGVVCEPVCYVSSGYVRVPLCYVKEAVC